MFYPNLEFEFEFKNTMPRAWLMASVTLIYVTWYIRREIVIGKGTDDDPYKIYIKDMNHYDLHVNKIQNDNEWNSRLSEARVWCMLPMISQSVTKEACAALWRIFCDVYYPKEIEDEYNAWIQSYAPELHEYCMDMKRKENNRTVKEVHSA
jgi:hypothetical protein